MAFCGCIFKDTALPCEHNNAVSPGGRAVALAATDQVKLDLIADQKLRAAAR
jgi:hypothetical protein